MKIKAENYLINCKIALRDCSNAHLSIQVVNLTLIRYNHELIECCLKFQVSAKGYQQIEAKALFNLKPHLRSSFLDESFLPDLDFDIEVMLKPNLLHFIQKNSATSYELSNYICQFSKLHTDHPLLLTENWLCLSVKQPIAPGERDIALCGLI
jgi:hypothetical protein